MTHSYQNESDEAPDEEVQELMENHNLDEDTAEQVHNHTFDLDWVKIFTGDGKWCSV